MRKIYAAAHRKDHKKTELVVMTKGKKGKISRPNGRYKLVDRYVELTSEEKDLTVYEEARQRRKAEEGSSRPEEERALSS
ncbi:hypothetical protein COOONC_07215 [Cooperia oncophora]